MGEEQSQSIVLSDCQLTSSYAKKYSFSYDETVGWKLQPIPLIIVFESFDTGAEQADTSEQAEVFCQTHYSWVIKNGFWIDERFGSCSCEVITYKIVSEKEVNNGTNWTSGEQTSACPGRWWEWSCKRLIWRRMTQENWPNLCLQEDYGRNRLSWKLFEAIWRSRRWLEIVWSFTGKFCLTNLLALCGEISGSVAEGSAECSSPWFLM